GLLRTSAYSDEAPGEVIVHRGRHTRRKLHDINLQRSVRLRMIEITRATAFRFSTVTLIEQPIVPNNLPHQWLQRVNHLLAVTVCGTNGFLRSFYEFRDGVLVCSGHGLHSSLS